MALPSSYREAVSNGHHSLPSVSAFEYGLWRRSLRFCREEVLNGRLIRKLHLVGQAAHEAGSWTIGCSRVCVSVSRLQRRRVGCRKLTEVDCR